MADCMFCSGTMELRGDLFSCTRCGAIDTEAGEVIKAMKDEIRSWIQQKLDVIKSGGYQDDYDKYRLSGKTEILEELLEDVLE